MHLERKTNGLGGALILVLCLLFFSVPAYGAGEKGKTVRVGYPVQAGFTEIGEGGRYSGYTYEYLQEIAQYTGWEYEYVTPEGNLDQQLTVLLDMLERGEIDIMGAMSYSESLAQIYAYPGYSYGTAYSTLAVLENNVTFTEFNYSTFDNIRVAVVSPGETENMALNQFAEINGFHVEQILCKTEEQQMKILEAGGADAALRRDVRVDEKNLRVIAKFSPQPFYFALYKGSRNLTGELNRTLEMINTTNPHYIATLYEKYFDSGAEMVLSQEERDYVENAGSFRVALLLGKAPFQYRDGSGMVKGVTLDVLSYITEQTGLSFDIAAFDTREEYEAALEEGGVAVTAGINSNYNAARAENYTMTIPFSYVPVLLAMNSKSGTVDNLVGKKAAVENTVYRAQDQELPTVLPCGTMEECLAAIYRGDADYCYGNSYSVQYYVTSKNYKNISTVAQSDSASQKYCFGIMKPVNMTLLSIMNKAIKALPEDQINTFLYDNAYNPGNMTLLDYIRRNPGQTALGMAVFCLAVLLMVLVLLETSRRGKISRKMLENQRYELLSEFSNEFLYEYDIRGGSLKLTEQTADFLGCGKEIAHPQEEMEQYPLFGYMISKEDGSREYKCTLPGGKECWLRFVSRIVSDPVGKPWFSVGKLVDIQKEREAKELLESRAQKDSLTGLFNSATGRQMIQRTLEEADGTGAMIIMDVDYFKQVNDDMGHYTGDQVLCETAEVLKTCFREDDIVGRLGGDEFVVFMKAVRQPELVKERCEDVLEKVRQVSEKNHGRVITMSIGAAMADSGTKYDALYRRADLALYRIKQQGRNGVEIVEAGSPAA